MIPEHPAQLRVVDIELDHVRRSYLRNALGSIPRNQQLEATDIAYLAAETRWMPSQVEEAIDEIRRTT